MSVGVDLERFRHVLEAERTRLLHAAKAVHHDGSLLEETGDLAIGSGDHLADSASETYMRELEALLRSTLVSAERAAQDMKEQARRESDLIVQEAHAESRRVTREAAAEKRRLEEDIVTIRSHLRAAFELLGQEPGADRKQGDEGAETAVTRPTPVEEVTEGGIRKVAG